MKFLVLIAWLTLGMALAAAPKFAVVRVTDIYRSLPSTAALQKSVQQQRNAVLQNVRAEQLRSIIGELQSLQTELQAKRDELDTEPVKKLMRDYEIKRQEAETLRQEFEGYRGEEEKRINREMVAAMRSSLDRIAEASQKIAKERNIDAVFDPSGNTNSGVPFVLHHGDALDLTDDVVDLLGEGPAIDAQEPQNVTAPETPEETN